MSKDRVPIVGWAISKKVGQAAKQRLGRTCAKTAGSFLGRADLSPSLFVKAYELYSGASKQRSPWGWSISAEDPVSRRMSSGVMMWTAFIFAAQMAAAAELRGRQLQVPEFWWHSVFLFCKGFALMLHLSDVVCCVRSYYSNCNRKTW